MSIDPFTLDIPLEFDSERLTIRTPRVRDAVEFNTAIRESFEEIRPWMPWAKSIPSIEETRLNMRRARRRFLQRKDLRLTLVLKGTDTIVGSSGLHKGDWNVPKFEIGYWVRTSFAGQGYITEAVNAITGFAVRHLAAMRIEIWVDDRNERSWRVAERCGYELEGIMRSHSLAPDGTVRDMRLYAKVMSEREMADGPQPR